MIKKIWLGNKFKIALLLIISFSLLINFWMVSGDVFFLRRDDLVNTYSYSLSLMDLEINDLYEYSLVINEMPFYLITTLPLYYLFGISTHVAVLNSYIYFTILILSIYGIGKELYTEKYALLSSFIAAFIPGIFAFSRTYSVHIGGMAIVSLCIYLMFKTNQFENRIYSLFFGVAFFLAFLVRWTSPLILAAPVLLYIYWSFKEGKILQKKNIIISISVFILLTCIYLLPIMGDFLTAQAEVKIYNSTIRSLNINERMGVSMEAISEIFFPLLLPFLILGMVSIITKRSKKLFIILSWLLGPMIIFTIYYFFRQPAAALSFLSIAAPSGALIISYPFIFLKKKKKSIFISILISSCIIQFILISFYPVLPLNLQLEVFEPYKPRSDHPIYAFPADWKIGEIIYEMGTNSPDSEKVNLYYLVKPPLQHQITPMGLKVYYREHFSKLQVTYPYKNTWWGRDYLLEKKPESIRNKDFVLIMNLTSLENFNHKDEYMRGYKAFKKVQNDFYLLKNWSYKSIKGPVSIKLFKRR